MSHEGLPTPSSNTRPLDAELRKDLIKLLVMAIPTVIVGFGTNWLKEEIFTKPGQALWITIPVVVLLCFLVFFRAKTQPHLKLGWPFLLFFPFYILTFSIAASTSILDWKQSLIGYQKQVPANFLALNRWGDWHYWFASQVPANQDVAVVLMDDSAAVDVGRLRIADLVAFAASSQAKGVALDFFFVDTGDAGKSLNEHFCEEIVKAKNDYKERTKDTREWPVYVVYDFRITGGQISRIRIDPDLENCLPYSNQAHALGYAEWDGRLRSIPLYFGTSSSPNSDEAKEALSLRIAKRLDPQVKVPSNGILQFVRPSSDLKFVRLEEWEKAYNEGDANKIAEYEASFRDRFVLIGKQSDQDSFLTPYGQQAGIMIHAYAIHSLRQNQFIKRSKWWISLLMICVMCYALMIPISRGTSNSRVILINVGFSIFTIAISIIAIYLWLDWIDVVYPLLAIWVFLIVLLALRRFTKSFSAEPVDGTQNEESGAIAAVSSET